MQDKQTEQSAGEVTLVLTRDEVWKVYDAVNLLHAKFLDALRSGRAVGADAAGEGPPQTRDEGKHTAQTPRVPDGRS